MKTIFVIEPDKLLAKQYAHCLAKKGRQVVTFATARLAARALEKVMPDLVVMELALPGNNGLEFLYEMQSYSDSQNVKILVNSFVQEADIPWGFINRGDIGIVAYLQKSFSLLSDIERAVNEHL